MLHLQSRQTGNHEQLLDLFGRKIDNTSTRETKQNMENHDNGNQVEGRIEFRPHDVDESDVASPPMWKSSSPTENSQLQSHYKSYQLLSPMSRSQVIARGQQELMEMIKDMPESLYELSLQDIVEQPIAQKLGLEIRIEEQEESSNAIRGKKRRGLGKKGYDKKQYLRTGSMSSEPFLLSNLFPTSWGSKNQKSSNMGPRSKLSPRPRMNYREGKMSMDKCWWKTRFAVAVKAQNNGSESKNRGSSTSINRESNVTYWSNASLRSDGIEERGPLSLQKA
ncbi:hypothetical protein Sjap_021736 [Stephania japonica]|uniref:Uncharacterized protein n=1 Tax=Stephania japonica TaxID=461633 RepID=A0AAP0HRZ5_9MAGN